MTNPIHRPATGRCAGRSNQLSKAKALAALQQQAAAIPSDPRIWWEQLLEEERLLQEREAAMTVVNLTWSPAAWTDLHDRSERLCIEMADCIAQLEGR